MALSKHILILSSRLDLPGGIERAVVNTANLLSSQGHAITVLVLDEITESFYPINKDVTVIHKWLHFGITNDGNALRRKKNFIDHIRQLRRELLTRKPDIILSSEYPFSIAAYLAATKIRAKIYAWEHHHFYHLKRNYFWQLLFKKIYPKLDGVVCLNEKEKKAFDAIGCRSRVIPNFIERQQKSSNSSRTLLTIGWLTKGKGVDNIPAIAEKVFLGHRDWHWKVIGAGPEEEWLKDEIKKKSLGSNLSVHPPMSPELSLLYQDCACYVMTSRMECFPMVLLEAMSFGIPCVAFDCPTGPSAIIRNNEDGYLVEQNDITAMASQIIDLMGNKDKRDNFGDNAQKNIERFSPANVYELWENLIMGQM